MKFSFATVLLFVFLVTTAHGATIRSNAVKISVTSQNSGTIRTASSCAQVAVQSAISASVDGDTIVIPAGSCTWANPISTAKGLTILGAGQNSTIITNNGFDISTPNSKAWRISGMTLKGSGCIGVYSNSKSWRIDNITFDKVSPGNRCNNRLIWIEPTGPDYTKGVIDHNIFIDPGAIQIHMRAAGDGGNGEFIRALGLGTDDAVYIENNQFLHSSLQISNPTTDCDGGGRLVFRYNTVQNSYFEMHDAIVGSLRSCRKWEVYENTFSMTYQSGQFAFIGIRGGTGVVFNNKFNPGAYYITSPIVVGLYRLTQQGESPWNILCSTNSGYFNGGGTTAPSTCTTPSTSCIKMDGPNANGYPCRDQFGFDGNNPQVSRPALIWGNTLSGSPYNKFDFNGPNTPTSHIQLNRDYCVGTTMPTSCNGLSTTYTPFTYPHPLVK